MTIQSTVELYPQQIKLLNSIKQSFASGKKRPMVQAPTGFGKSYIIGTIIKSAIDKGAERVVLIVDVLTLVEQLCETLENVFGLDVGIIQGLNDKTNLEKSVQIATPQTLSRRFESKYQGYKFKHYKVDLLVVDEAHMKFKGTTDAMDYWGCKSIGFTATPYAKGLGLVYDDLVKSVSLGELMKTGALSKYKAFSHKQPDLTGLKVGANGDISGSAERYTDELIGHVFNTWKGLASDRLTIGFAPTIAKCESFAKLFRSNGIESMAIHSKLSDDDSAQLIKDFKDKKIKVLWSVAKLVKGFDVPELSCLIDCQPTASLIRFQQKIGRATRPHKDKDYAIIIDHAGNFIRNGLIEDIDIDELHKKDKKGEENPDRKKKTDPKPITCGDCGAVYNSFPNGGNCEECGSKIEKKSQSIAPDSIEWVDGELVEYVKKSNNKNMSKDEKKEFYGGLRLYGKRARFKDGWAAFKYKEYFGVWPNAYKDAKLCEPSKLVNAFINASIKQSNMMKRR